MNCGSLASTPRDTIPMHHHHKSITEKSERRGSLQQLNVDVQRHVQLGAYRRRGQSIHRTWTRHRSVGGGIIQAIRSCVEDLPFCACRRQSPIPYSLDSTPTSPSHRARCRPWRCCTSKSTQEGEPTAHSLKRVNVLIKPNQCDAKYGHPFKEGRNRVGDRMMRG
jgi:hypothetical protein